MSRIGAKMVVFDPDVERVFRQADMDTQNKLRISDERLADELKRNEGLVAYKNELLDENVVLTTKCQSQKDVIDYIKGLTFFQRLLFLFFKGEILKQIGGIK